MSGFEFSLNVTSRCSFSNAVNYVINTWKINRLYIQYLPLLLLFYRRLSHLFFWRIYFVVVILLYWYALYFTLNTFFTNTHSWLSQISRQTIQPTLSVNIAYYSVKLLITANKLYKCTFILFFYLYFLLKLSPLHQVWVNMVIESILMQEKLQKMARKSIRLS